MTLRENSPIGDTPVLDIRSLTKAYGAKVVLNNLDFQVPAGSVVGLLGKNGAGKTTLIKCALGLVKPQAGTTRLLGEDSWTLSAAAKARLGFVPQSVHHYPWMRVRQLLEYTASFYPRWNRDLIAGLMRSWELSPEECVGPLSVGQQQKLAILLALGHEPEVLVLDEPAAALDPVARREFLRTLLEIADHGRRTVLLSTHITSDVERVADRVAILRDGRIVYHDELDQLKDRVKRLHITAPAPLPVDVSLPGVAVLRRRVEGCEAAMSVNGYVPELAAVARERWSATVEVEDLNLEDIFLELHDEANAGLPVGRH